VATILDASVRRDGRRVRINARLVDTASGFTLWSDSFDRELDDVFAVQGEIAAEVTRKLLGVLPQGGAGLRARLAPTGELAAYDAYLKGRDQLAGAQGDASLEAAIGHFRRALMIDRGFSRASAGICRIEIKRFEANRGAAAFERARSACDEAARMAPELREVSLALGEMHRVRGDGDAAAEQYTRALDDLSLRPAAWVGLARLRSAGGDDALAREYFRRALELRPGDPGIHRELGLHQYSTGDIEGAIASFLTATTLLPDDATLWSSVGGLYLASGDSERAVDAFHRSLAIAPSYGALSNLGTLRYGQGEYADAAELYRQAAALDPGDFRIWGNIGDALAAAGDAPEASASAYARAVRLAEEYLAIKRDDAQASA
jgi:tetratricopeptide (TPR) repeat protein